MTANPSLDHTRAVTGEFSLYVPGDWIDLLADGSGPGADVAAQARFEDLVRQTYPKAEPEIAEAAIDGLLAWRAMVTERGIVSHGIVSCPLQTDAAEGWAAWHVLSAVLDFPHLTPDVNVGELLARLVGQQLDDSAYVESFSTDMGCGVGLVRGGVRSGCLGHGADPIRPGCGPRVPCGWRAWPIGHGNLLGPSPTARAHRTCGDHREPVPGDSTGRC